MGEFVECVQGISEASKYLNFPVVSGNVSFYNETKDKGIKPTPSIPKYIKYIKEKPKLLRLQAPYIRKHVAIKKKIYAINIG